MIAAGSLSQAQRGTETPNRPSLSWTRFSRWGRDLAAWLGLVPRQFTTDGKPKLLGISKRGNKYLGR